MQRHIIVFFQHRSKWRSPLARHFTDVTLRPDSMRSAMQIRGTVL
ncbi:MAG: hypothetical protein AB4352_17610 [Hormoscilla sp.]